MKHFLPVPGFIDFIVDPSFAVMGDMLERVLQPLHGQHGHSGQGRGVAGDAISEEGDGRDSKAKDRCNTSHLSRKSPITRTCHFFFFLDLFYSMHIKVFNVGLRHCKCVQVLRPVHTQAAKRCGPSTSTGKRLVAQRGAMRETV